MVWPTADIPTYGRGVWLECNGQSFSTTQFPQLYETLGTNRVPDYQGMFLRGYGSQSYSQNNGEYTGHTTRNYSSGNIGQIQGDALMEIASYAHLQEGGMNNASTRAESKRQIENIIRGRNGCVSEIENTGYGVYNFYYMNGTPDNIQGGVYFTDYNTNFYQNINGHYEYELNYSTSSDEDGNEHIESIELIPTWHDNNTANVRTWNIWFSSKQTIPTDDEIRPINVAVKFMIKAK